MTKNIFTVDVTFKFLWKVVLQNNFSRFFLQRQKLKRFHILVYFISYLNNLSK